MDISGRRFGRLTVIKKTTRKDAWGRCYLYRCRCDCGRVKLTTSTMLLSGQVRSCGCLQREARKRDITGERRGALIAVRPTGQLRAGSAVWVWRCDCGREIKATIDQVFYSGLRSCGCRNREIKRSQAIAAQAHCLRVDGTDVSRIRNNRVPKNNTSGVVGVSYNHVHDKWYARISFKGRSIWLGAYGDKGKAVRARRRAEREYFKSFLESL